MHLDGSKEWGRDKLVKDTEWALTSKEAVGVMGNNYCNPPRWDFTRNFLSRLKWCFKDIHVF